MSQEFCPFCGCDDDEKIVAEDTEAICENCGARAPLGIWNTRHQPAAVPLVPMCDDPNCWVCKRMTELHNATGQFGCETRGG